MNEHALIELLEERADSIDVGPAPVAAMTRAAGARRGRAVGLAAAAAVVAVAGAVVWWPDGPAAPDRAVSPTETTGADTTVQAPDGYRLVGLGIVAVAVPKEWATNALRCGTPTSDTVVIDSPVIEACLHPRPRDVDSVEIRLPNGVDDPNTWTPTEVDGAEARRSPLTETLPYGDGPSVHSGAVFLTEAGVVVAATSTTSAATVDDLLSRVVLLDGEVAVPGHEQVNLDRQERASEAYLDLLSAFGLEARVVLQPDYLYSPGFVVGVSPAPGTVVEQGTTVTVRVSSPD